MRATRNKQLAAVRGCYVPADICPEGRAIASLQREHGGPAGLRLMPAPLSSLPHPWLSVKAMVGQANENPGGRDVGNRDRNRRGPFESPVLILQIPMEL
jgi:hypothetical protein